MKQKLHIGRGFTLVELLVVIVIIAALAGLTAPMVIRQRKKADQTEAVNNAKQIGLAMFEFENEYGSFPQGTLGADINARTGNTLAPTSITTSNDAFKQLMASDIAKSEQMFYCKTSFSRTKPDNNTTGGSFLKAGEVGFSYMLFSDDTALSSSINPSTPIVVAPLLTRGASAIFDRDMYDSKGVVLRVDQSVSSLNINPTGEIVLTPAAGNSTAQTLMTTGNSTVWGSRTPKMIPPQ
jgi:prepilin-type N-terminal cleavage/methylation domain-containing protein